MSAPTTEQPRRARWLSERARVAALTRDRAPDDPDLIDARRQLRYLRLHEHIDKILESAPPLTDEQRDALASLLAPVRRAG